jgi:hypothetical protein
MLTGSSIVRRRTSTAISDRLDAGVFEAAETDLVERLQSSCFTAETVRAGTWFRAIVVKDPSSNERLVVDLGYDYRQHPPVHVNSVGPVLDVGVRNGRWGAEMGRQGRGPRQAGHLPRPGTPYALELHTWLVRDELTNRSTLFRMTLATVTGRPRSSSSHRGGPYGPTSLPMSLACAGRAGQRGTRASLVAAVASVAW